MNMGITATVLLAALLAHATREPQASHYQLPIGRLAGICYRACHV